MRDSVAVGGGGVSGQRPELDLSILCYPVADEDEEGLGVFQ